MRLILTHEQADFDAIASLLGAYLLDNNSIPVLPRKLNRNVRSFITLYGADLPFVDAGDLPAGKIESVTLVDTQSLITIKGMEIHTQVRVMDHHPFRKDLPSNWEVSHLKTGSTTAYLAELIAESHRDLSVVQATLLLLGIYEDTGSLTYSSTTGRDARASGYLIDQEADLEILTKFLNSPLSAGQKEFFDKLAANAKVHIIKGHRIIITYEFMDDFNEEISSLAHKLRDFFDPDGLFVIVSTNEGIRLVARSTTDHIDVGAIAGYFGGGGHDRAAAALIRKNVDNDIEDIYHLLLDILPKYVTPSITVAQIMSGRPHLLSPQTSVSEASRLMRNYGYEGYPVVENGKVIGLLTRKVVDKALNHKLNLTAGSLMDANNVWVNPDDSIQQLQTCMTESGWGQIPVVDPISGNVIGIVTRTDLLKLLTQKSMEKDLDNLGHKLSNALPSNHLAIIRSVASVAVEERSPIYIVGGFVRDLMLDRPSTDFDIVVEGDAIQMAKIVSSKYGGSITIHKRFGTAKWYLNNSNFQGSNAPEFLDFITARLEFYAHPTALPTIERSSIKFDLHRRDFTINTLALRLDGRHFGELFDFWGGLSDIRGRIIRVLHSLSFVDDPTRMLRAIRFEQRFGFRIEDRTLQLMLNAKGLLGNISGDRIRHEMNLIFEESKNIEIMSRLAELGLLKAIHPALTWDPNIQEELSGTIGKVPPDNWVSSIKMQISTEKKNLIYLLWLSHVPGDDLVSVCKRLKLSESLRRNIQDIQRIIDIIPKMKKSSPSRICSELDEIHPLAIFVASLKMEPDSVEILDKYMLSWKIITPKTSGNDLRERGIPPGPVYQKILERLRSAWLDGEISSPQDEMTLLERIIMSGL